MIIAFQQVLLLQLLYYLIKPSIKSVSCLPLIRLGFGSLERMGNTEHADNQNSRAEGLGIYLAVLMNQWWLLKVWKVLLKAENRNFAVMYSYNGEKKRQKPRVMEARPASFERLMGTT